MTIVDLSMTVGPHFRWSPEISVTGDKSAGDQFRVTRLSTTCHGFSHVDAQAHFIENGPTIEATPLDRVVGPCRIFDLSAVAPDEEIGPETLAAADPGGAEGEILLLAAQWDLKRDAGSREFWTESPWLNRAAAEYLLAQKPSAVAVDFPQDYPIRLLLDGIAVPDAEHVTHDVLLRAGVTLIEYVVNTAALKGPRTFLCAAPLKIGNADGAPARIFAIEDMG
ncbi:cyclase family protein [Rhodovulum sulfidophilum]|uniref:cyclase family protein n=1 Tax=Rhodovulum sulfidophilum TaxID=35806 RepID=UPI000950EB59|nr:cyclase family protein [Rhodovulum sulfidophilum]MBL3552206.1 cyclase family protein [Rhodovulum sulfidophilum]OLS46943.1 cyclase [Rhodovulum sulfidophilum]